MTGSAPPIPAATLVLFRARPEGHPELLMIERGSNMRFAAGAYVFPGGRIDPGDHDLAATLVAEGSDPYDIAARVAAVRETIEEVGIAVGLTPLPDAATIARLRAALEAGGDFAALLADEGLKFDPAALTPFARWLPDFAGTRRFDTLFFVAEAPSDGVATPDGGESVHAVWTTAQALLDQADAGHRHIIFPTRRNLELLATLASVEAVRAFTARHPVSTISPWVEERDGEQWLCIPDDRGYPVCAERLKSAMRG